MMSMLQPLSKKSVYYSMNKERKYMTTPDAVDKVEPASLQRVSYGIFELADWSYAYMKHNSEK